jgi:hypothetical protein
VQVEIGHRVQQALELGVVGVVDEAERTAVPPVDVAASHLAELTEHVVHTTTGREAVTHGARR